MIEILDRLDVLARAVLDLSDVTLAGVHCGSRAAGSVPRDRVTRVTPAGGYYGAVGSPPSPADLVDGTIHLADGLSYKITAGVVVGFTVYGQQHLDHFRDIDSYEEFLVRFGTPDHIEKAEAFGGIRGYRNYYWRASKQAYWDTGANRLTMITLGAYEDNIAPWQRVTVLLPELRPAGDDPVTRP